MGMIQTTLKTCTTCGETKPLDEFYAHPQMRERRLNSCKECRKAYSRAWHKAGGGKKSRYGITPEQYAELLAEQGNACAICTTEFLIDHGDRGPHIDHDHRSGQVRGLLCKGCNARLGWLERRQERILNYLGFLSTTY
jgi:hypothetical protein